LRVTKLKVPYVLAALDEIRLVVSEGLGAEAEILTILSSLDSEEIIIEDDVDDDGSYFNIVFSPSWFDDLPGREYLYEIYGYIGATPYVLALPATLTIEDGIGPPAA
jgi:hypothetical protein